MIVDCVGAHLEAAGSIERAAVPIGMYLAWCANLRLLSEPFERDAERLLLRLRFREIAGSELLVAGCGGALEQSHLDAQGVAFTARYYQHYLRDLGEVFGEQMYAVKDDWDHYDQIAPVLTRALMRPAERRRHWWAFWQ